MGRRMPTYLSLCFSYVFSGISKLRDIYLLKERPKVFLSDCTKLQTNLLIKGVFCKQTEQMPNLLKRDFFFF